MQALSAALPGIASGVAKVPESFVNRWGLRVAAADLVVVMLLFLVARRGVSRILPLG